jgi:hypothetical protein
MVTRGLWDVVDLDFDEDEGIIAVDRWSSDWGRFV